MKKIMYRKINTETWDKIVNLYTSGDSVMSISKIFNIGDVYLRRLLHKANIFEYRPNKRFFNENFFDIIDTEEKAYILGFLFADGYNDEKNHTISIQLHEKDLQLLNMISNMLDSKKSIQKIINKFGIYYRISLSSKHMSSRLAELGCMQAKTFKITFPEWLDESLQHHFIRGYFDGDGCVWITKVNNKIKTPSLNIDIIGTDIFVDKLQDIINKNIDYNKKNKLRTRHPERNNNIRSIKYGGNHICTKIFNYMYKDATIFLQRKFDKFNTIIIDLDYQNKIKTTKSL
jgi:intein-encoded DNA endonuclease-like protein